MRDTTLLKPGTLSTSNRLRREVAYAISQVEVAKANGATGEGSQLSAFLLDAASKTPGYTGPVLPSNQAIVNNGDILNSTGTGTTVTLSVVGGVITAVLS